MRAAQESRDRERQEQERKQALAQLETARVARDEAKKKFEVGIDVTYARLADLVANQAWADAQAVLARFKEFGHHDYKEVKSFDAMVRTAIALEKVASLPPDDIKARLSAYTTLATLHPENVEYVDEHKRLQVLFSEQESKRIAAEQEAARKAAEAEARKKRIEACFRPDGSHRSLSAQVKEAMKNPASYEHVKTVYVDKGDYVLVKMTYRGTNSFNAVVTNAVVAKTGLDGRILEIISE
jgi:hypothetical protein